MNNFPESGKMRVNRKQSRALQQKLFELGYTWGKGEKNFLHLRAPHLYWLAGSITWTGKHQEKYFVTDPRREYQFSDLNLHAI